MISTFKRITRLLLCSVILSACDPVMPVPIEPDAGGRNADQSSGITVGGTSSDDQTTNCSDLKLAILDAAWAKNPADQAPHRLEVIQPDGTVEFHDLGIDRSPDFFFKIYSDTINNMVILSGASRAIAYDCQNDTIQDLDLSLGADFEALDAQSGLIDNIASTDNHRVIITLRDYGALQFQLNADRSFTR
jgi:hypothetical protein